MKPWFLILSRILTVAAVGFFVVYVGRQLQGLEPGTWSNVRWGLLAVGLVVYVGSNFLYPVAWRTLLAFTGQSLELSKATAVFFESQFAKYLPGNVAQHFGRVLLSHPYEISSGAVALTLAVEFVWGAATAAVIALLSITAGAVNYGLLPAGFSLPVLAVFICSAFFLPTFLLRFAGVIVRKVPQLRAVRVPAFRPTLSGTMGCVAIYSISLIVFGGLTWIATVAIGLTSVPILPIMACTITSWLAGFLTPGSPAGAGVRDSIIVLGLSAVMPPPEAALVALLHRLLTATGDFLLFLIGKWLNARLGPRPYPSP